MRRPLPVQVEPLSPQRWTKIQRSLFTRLEAEPVETPPPSDARRPLRRSIPWLAAAALLGVLLFVVHGKLGGEQAAIDHTSRITTGPEASHLALPGLSLDVAPESTVVLGGAADRGMLIVVDRGSVVCEVAPRPAQAPLIVQAGSAQVRVVGTRFRVTRVGDSARVAVERGVVEVAAGGRLTRVQAGQVWPAPVTPVVEPPGSAADPVAMAPEPVRRQATRSKPTTPPRAEKSADTPPDAADASAQERFEQATRLERSDPARAKALYRSVERGSDSWAQNALYAHGRLEAARGNEPEARRLLEQYLTRFPNGANADDARALLGRLR